MYCKHTKKGRESRKGWHVWERGEEGRKGDEKGIKMGYAYVPTPCKGHYAPQHVLTKITNKQKKVKQKYW